MPEVTLQIGGRDYKVVCEPGEEDQLHHAAALIGAEADRLQDGLGRVPETRMLLMAGLMLADRMVELETTLGAQEARIQQMQAQLRSVEERAAQMAAKALHADAPDRGAELEAARAEAEAARYALMRATETVERFAAEAAAGQAG